MLSTGDRYPAFEARSHTAHRGAMLTLHGDSEHRDAEPQQRSGEWHAFRHLVAFSINHDLNECRHQCIRGAIEGITRVGE